MTMETTSNPPFASDMKGRKITTVAEWQKRQPPSRHLLATGGRCRPSQAGSRLAGASRGARNGLGALSHHICKLKGQLLSPLRDRWKIIVAMDRLLAHMLATAKHERYRGERYGDQRSEGGAKTLWCFGCHHGPPIIRYSWPTPAPDRGSCIGSTSKKLSKDQGVGAVKFFTGEIRGNGLPLSWRKEWQQIVHDLTFPQGTIAVRPSCLPNPQPRNRTSALPELASSFFIG